MSLSLYLLSPIQLRRGPDRMALVGIWHLARVNTPQSLKYGGAGVNDMILTTDGADQRISIANDSSANSF